MTMVATFDARPSLMLAALTPFERERWLLQLEPVELRAGQVLQQAGRSPAYAYFPL